MKKDKTESIKFAGLSKGTDRTVQEALEYIESIVDTVREPLVILDADLRVITANRSFYQTYKVTPEETERQLIYDLGNRQWDIPRLRELLEQILPLNTVFNDFEIVHDFETIGRRTMLLNARRVYREANKTQMILLAIEDVTERKQAEEELRKAQEELDRKERLAILGQLAGGVGHELRNPLGAIKNAAYFLKMTIENPEPEVKESLEILEKEVATSEKIITSLLGFIHPKPPTLRKVDINNLVRDMMPQFSVPENVEVETRLESLPVILADPNQIGQVLQNIIYNGIQSMPEGGRLAIKSTPREPAWVEVSIADTGTGMSDDVKQKIFEPLFTTKAKGIGLGLAVSKTLVEGNRGTIDVESEIGKGSTFTLRLPIGGKEEE